jgi:hypothetical protein
VRIGSESQTDERKSGNEFQKKEQMLSRIARKWRRNKEK